MKLLTSDKLYVNDLWLKVFVGLMILKSHDEQKSIY